MSVQIERETSPNVIAKYVILALMVFLCIGLSFKASKQAFMGMNLEAAKIYTTLATPQYSISCDPIRRINNGVPMDSFSCYGTALCSAIQTDKSLIVYSNMTGNKLFSIFRTKDHLNIDQYVATSYLSFDDYYGMCSTGENLD